MGTIINGVAILIGGAPGLLFRKGFPKRIEQTAFGIAGDGAFKKGDKKI